MDINTELPLGFPRGGFPYPQGRYYCSVGGRYTWGRELVEEHLNTCLAAGLNIEGINQEVAPGQWEFQNFAKGAKKLVMNYGSHVTFSTGSPKGMDIILNYTLNP